MRASLEKHSKFILRVGQQNLSIPIEIINYAGHPGFYRFRALGSLQFFEVHSMLVKVNPSETAHLGL